MINYWLQVDNVTKDGLLNTLSLCRALKAPLSEPPLPLTASSCLLSPPPQSSTYTATEWKGVPTAFFFFFTIVSVYSKLLSLTWDALQLLLWAGLQLITLTCSRPPRIQYNTNPPLGFKEKAAQQAHALENACGLINSISGGKTRLHPSHVVQENSLETCRQIAYKPPLGRMLLKTCDHKYVVVPDIADHSAGFFFFLLCTFGSTGNAPWPQIPWWMWNPKSSPSGVSNLPPSHKYNFNCSLRRMNLQSWNSKWSKTLQPYPSTKVINIHCAMGLENILMTYNQELEADFCISF